MKSTGIIRKIDELGRLVLPIELRRSFDLNIKDSVEIYTDKDMIILKKFEHKCIFCDCSENLIKYKGKKICPECIENLKLV